MQLPSAEPSSTQNASAWKVLGICLCQGTLVVCALRALVPWMVNYFMKLIIIIRTEIVGVFSMRFVK